MQTTPFLFFDKISVIIGIKDNFDYPEVDLGFLG